MKRRATITEIIENSSRVCLGVQVDGFPDGWHHYIEVPRADAGLYAVGEVHEFDIPEENLMLNESQLVKNERQVQDEWDRIRLEIRNGMAR